jgi:hypothetical protein
VTRDPTILATGYAELPHHLPNGVQMLNKPFDEEALAAACRARLRP